MKVNIEGLDKAEILRRLYNKSKVQGLGYLDATGTNMGYKEASGLLEESNYFDYVHGKVLKLNLSSDTELDVSMYDRDNGDGAARKVIQDLRSECTLIK